MYKVASSFQYVFFQESTKNKTTSVVTVTEIATET